MNFLTASILIAGTAFGGAALAQSAPSDTSGRPDPADRAARFVEVFDGNGDGAVTAEEIEAHRLRHFTAADADENNNLDAEELGELLRLIETERLQHRAERMLARLDQDGDGVLSAEELPRQGADGFMMQGDRGHQPDGSGYMRGKQEGVRGEGGPRRHHHQ